MKIALVHEFLTQFGGAERVLQAIHEMYPNAPIFVLVKSDAIVEKYFPKADIRTSFLQNLPGNPGRYKWYLPLMPRAIESFDFTGYDLVISDSSAFAKGVMTKPPTKHISYIHTPTRYLWGETDFYLKTNVPWYIRPFIRIYIPKLRAWDLTAARRPDVVIANSKEVQNRIKKYYNRDSQIIHPFIPDAYLSPPKGGVKRGDFYLMGGRLVLYKRYDIVIEAFKKSGRRLLVSGSGAGEQALKKQAAGLRGIRFTGHVSDQQLKRLYHRAKAYIFPGLDDFGMTPLEAMACGAPVICLGQGGALETVINGTTGVYFASQTAEAVNQAIERFERVERFKRNILRRHALQFSQKKFTLLMKGAINGTTGLS